MMKLTIDKFQKLQAIAAIETDEIEKASRLVQVLLDKSPEEINEMHVKDFTMLCDKLKSLFDITIDAATMAKPKDIIKANGKTYRVNYELKKPFNTGRYIEVLTFSKGDPITNMHNILASICVPTKWSWTKFKYIDAPYDTIRHEDYADDLKQADFKHGYHAMVFFYLFLMHSTGDSSLYLEEKLTEMMVQDRKIIALKSIFPILSGGFTTQNK